jgi:serine/threonine protein kinase
MGCCFSQEEDYVNYRLMGGNGSLNSGSAPKSEERARSQSRAVSIDDIPPAFDEPGGEHAADRRRLSTSGSAADLGYTFQKFFKIGKVLGKGATSTCYACTQAQTKQRFACKVIERKMFQEHRDQMLSEIKILTQLQHPSIVSLEDVFITEKKICIVTELLRGGELFDVIMELEFLDEDEARSIVQQIGSGLVYMHAQNVTHRDLKPGACSVASFRQDAVLIAVIPAENLMLKEKWRKKGDPMEVKIVDFGLSKCLADHGVKNQLLRMETPIGTPRYCAPEIASRQLYTKAVDMWSTGVILYVLLVGVFPFDQPVQNALVPANSYSVQFPTGTQPISEGAKDVLLRLLAVDPNERMTAEQLVEHPWVTGQQPGNGSFLSPTSLKSNSTNGNIKKWFR